MNKVIAIVGPTASGKTKLAIEMAKNLGTEIISADSRLVYKGFDIGTAKPTKEEQQMVKHHMIDVVEPEYDFSVADFADEARKIISNLHAHSKVPIVAGGTGLYFRILLENYDMPRIEANPQLRADLEKLSNEELFVMLKEVDSISAEKIHQNNRVRVIRALEVSLLAGTPFSSIKGIKNNEYEVEWVFPELESREALYDRINKRVDAMISEGLIEETKDLLVKHGKIKNLVNTIGYQEIIEFLDNKISLEEAVEKIKQNTRRYAKRQLTWFRRNPNLHFDL
mgnify:FL=1